MMLVSDIARVAHEVNRAYCDSIGDNSQNPWENAPKWQQDSACEGVKFAQVYYFQNGKWPAPHTSHDNWLKQKDAEGWVYGPKKDPEAKRHPCMVPYDKLPQEQRVKDHLFLAVVSNLSTVKL